MEIKIVENVKETKCDAIIINKFEGRETACEMANKFLPEKFNGKKGEIFVLHTHKEIPADYILVLGLGKEEELDNNVIRESVSKAIKKCNGLKLKSVAIDFATNYNYGGPAVLGAEISNYHFDVLQSYSKT